MDGDGPLLTAIRAALANFDDEALAALASKGLVRRARKDLELARPAVLGPGDDRLRVEVGDGIAAIALPPSRSTCDCPAGGICRHILAALIHLRESAPAGPVDAGPVDAEVLAVDAEALAKWAGRPMVAKALKALGFGLPAEFEGSGALVVRFPTRNVACRWMPGGGLAGMVCSCHAPGPCEHRVAAVLAFQASKGARSLADAPELKQAATEAPRTRVEVLGSVRAVLRDLIAPGTSRLSRSSADRLGTLAISAHGVDLPRLEKALRALADEVGHALARDAQADSSRILDRASRVEALRSALLRRPTADLVGEHRTAYEPVGDVEVIGLGARRWRSPGGFSGLTLYFWDRSARGWATWTDARPSTVGAGFDPAARHRAEGPWSGVSCPEEAARSVLRLQGAWRNRLGRLSGRPSTRAIVLGRTDPDQVPGVVARWPDLVDRAARAFGGGARDRDGRDALVLIAPAAWGPARFDPARQEMTRPVLDADGRSIPLVLPQSPETAGAVDALAAHDPAGTRSLLGSLRLEAGRLAVEPIAFHTDRGVSNPTLDGTPPRSAPRPSPAAEDPQADPEGPEDPDEIAPSPSRLGRLLGALAAQFEAIGEGGLASYRGSEALRDLGARAGHLGLSAAAEATDRVVDHLNRIRKGEQDDPAAAVPALLHAYRVARIAAANEAILAATETIGA